MSDPIEGSELHSRLEKITSRGVFLTWAFGLWLLGAAVWAGSTYQRFQSMDMHLVTIDQKLDQLNDVKVIRQRQDDNMERIRALEKAINDLEQRR